MKVHIHSFQYPLLEQTSEIYMKMEVYMAGTSSPKPGQYHSPGHRQIALPNDQQCVRLHHALKDLGTVLQVFNFTFLTLLLPVIPLIPVHYAC